VIADAARPFSPWWPTLLIAIVLAGVSFALQGYQGINLADEGFLWYGVQRTSAGDVPLRDFQSYDPGRYYWCAAGAAVFGRGLVALRLSEMFAQCVGLYFGLLAARRLTSNWGVLGAIGLMLTVWMFPSHKIFDHALLLTGIWMATRMVERPSRPRVIVAGAFVGLCTFFGRNHALYNGVAEFGLLLLLCFKMRAEVPFSQIAAWCVGVIAGLTPLLLMLLFVPGFSASYEESIRAIFQNGANLSLPMPWPWGISFAGDPAAVAHRLVMGVLVVVLPIGYFAALCLCALRPAQFLKRHALFMACGAVGLLYLHHAFSRADISHFAQTIHPFTLGLLASPFLLARRPSYLLTAATVFTAVGIFAVARQMPIYQRLTSPVAWVRCNAVDGIYLRPDEKRLIDDLRQFAAAHIGPEEGLLIAPSAPGLYAILDRVSPLWEIYFLFPSPKLQQEEMVRALKNKNVNWAIVHNLPTDQREDLLFSATHALVWKYLKKNFQPIPDPRLPGSMTILRRAGVNQGAPAREISPPSVH